MLKEREGGKTLTDHILCCRTRPSFCPQNVSKCLESEKITHHEQKSTVYEQEKFYNIIVVHTTITL